MRTGALAEACSELAAVVGMADAAIVDLRAGWRIAIRLRREAQLLGLPLLAQVFRRLAEAMADQALTGEPLARADAALLARCSAALTTLFRSGLGRDELAIVLDSLLDLPQLVETADSSPRRMALQAELAPWQIDALAHARRMGGTGTEADAAPAEAAAIAAAESAAGQSGGDEAAVSHAAVSDAAIGDGAIGDAAIGEAAASDAAAAKAGQGEPVLLKDSELLSTLAGLGVELSAEELAELALLEAQEETPDPLQPPIALARHEDADSAGDAASAQIPAADDRVSGAFTADSDADDEAADPTAAIWVSAEELELMHEACSQQLLPLALQWDADTADAGGHTDGHTDAHTGAHTGAGAGSATREELAYQLSLVSNALELMGLTALAAVAAHLQQACAQGRTEASAMVMAVAALIDYLQTPDVPAVERLLANLQEGGLLPDAVAEPLRRQAGRVQIGLDPARLAERKTQVSPEDLSLQPAPDVLANVLDSMLRELPGNALRFGAAVRAVVEAGAQDSIAEPLDEARRIAHTLKGDANTVGVVGLANLTHALEDILIELIRAGARPPAALADLLLDAADTVEECSDHLLGRAAAPERLGEIYQRTLDCANALLAGEALPESVAASSPSASSPPVAAEATGALPLPAAVAAADLKDAPTEPASAEAAGPAAMVTVEAGLLDEMQRLSGELLALGRQIGLRLERLTSSQQELSGAIAAERDLVGALDDLVALRGAALQTTTLGTDAAADALELDQYNELHTVSRRIIESNADSEAFIRGFGQLLNELEDLRLRQSQLDEDMQRAVAGARRVAFASVVPRLQRVVRQTARMLGREVVLEIEGEQALIDADLLDRIVEPLSHVLRNAVDHGIEPPEHRSSAGKPAAGRIHIEVQLAGDALNLQIEDDGRGLDLGAVADKAWRLGLLDTQAAISEEQAGRLIMTPGFSTRDEVSQVSGRGVGLDVVAQRLRELRGSASVRRGASGGMQVNLRAPLSRAAADVLVVSGRQQLAVAVVLSAVERIVALAPEHVLEGAGGTLQVELDGRRQGASTLESLFSRQGAHSLPGDGSCLGLQVRLNDTTTHFVLVTQVDEVLRSVIRPISPLFPSIDAVRGMTQLSDGRVAAVVDIEQLIEARSGGAGWSSAALMAQRQGLPKVVIADDSLSVRRALQQLMQDAGFEAHAARDGVEAVQLIAQHTPVAVLLDLEMPRLNGLEVCRHIRNQPATRDLPVLMITSRGGERHRGMAAEAGVSRLLSKPFVEDELVTLVRQLVAQAG